MSIEDQDKSLRPFNGKEFFLERPPGLNSLPTAEAKRQMKKTLAEMGMKEPFVIGSDTNLWEYIGDLSQDLLECSYNEDDIRQMWRDGALDEYAADKLTEYPHVLKGYFREDGRYTDLLTALVTLHRGWAPHWGPEVAILNQQEQAIVAAFNAKYDIVISKLPGEVK